MPTGEVDYCPSCERLCRVVDGRFRRHYDSWLGFRICSGSGREVKR